MINFLIVHYNTPKLTECLIKSINKFVGTDCRIYIFDNSNAAPFKYQQENLTVFDNTRGAIINFDTELKKYPNHKYSLGSRSKWGSFKHCIRKFQHEKKALIVCFKLLLYKYYMFFILITGDDLF